MSTSIDNLTVESAMTVGGISPTLRPQNIIYVQTNPGPGDFSSIVSALASITTASQSNPFLVKVGPGVYTEAQITMKSWVWVEGAEQDQTVIQTSSYLQHAVLGADNSGISKCTITGSTGTGYAAIFYQSSNSSVQKTFYVENVRFGNCDTLAISDGTNAPTVMFVVGCSFGQQYQFNKGFITRGSAFLNRINLRNTATTAQMTATYPTELFTADGTNAEIVLLAVQCNTGGTSTGSAIHITNGGKVRATAVFIKGFAKGMWAENTGSGPILKCAGVVFESCTQDIVIDHPSTTGAFDGVADRTKVSINASALISLSYSNPSAQDTTHIGPIYQGDRQDRLANISKLIRNTASLGVAGNGGVITGTGGLNISVSSGNGFLDNPSDATLEEITWTTAAILLPANSENYIYVDSTNTVGYQSSLPSFYTTIVLGRVVTTAAGIRFIDQSLVNMEHTGVKTEEYLREYLGTIFKSGSTVTESGTRNLNVTAGHFSYGLTEWLPTGGVGVSWTSVYRDGGSGYIYGAQSQVDNANYDNNAGSLTALTAGYYAKHAFYLVGSGVNEAYFLVYSQVQYATLVEAEQGNIPTPPSTFKDGMALIATLVVKQGTTTIVEIRDERPRLGFHASGVSASSTHGNLLGLSADDHTQYLLINGTRAMSGALNMNSQNINNAATIGIGTASPGDVVEISADSGTTNKGIIISNYGSNDGRFLLRHALGTPGSPSALTSGARGGIIGFTPYTGAAWGVVNAAITSYVDENQNPSAQGAHIRFETTAIGSASRTEKMRITGDGKVGIGTTPTLAPLQVGGITGTTTAIFGTGLNGIALVAGDPIIGFNSYYDTGFKSLATGYGGTINMSMGTGSMIFSVAASVSGTGTAQTFVTGMTITNAGLVGIGATPTARLGLPAGAAAANGAPLKFTSGTNLTTPEAGAVEWNGTNLFITQTSGPTRKTVAYTDSNITGTSANVTGTVAVANGGTGTATGSITSTTALTFTAGGSNQNVNLTPSGTGYANISTNLNIPATTTTVGQILQAGVRWAHSYSSGTFVGNLTGNLTMTGLYNSVFGSNNFLANTSGASNVAIGRSALTANTTGGSNVAIGQGPMNANTTGLANTAIGANTLLVSNGDRNIAIGAAALSANTSGGYNIAIGDFAGTVNTTGDHNIFIGASANSVGTGLTYAVAIGAGALVSQSDSIVIGSTQRVGINTAAPSAYLHLPAGTITAGFAPLKFTSGTNLTTAENGAIEYDGNNFYQTTSGLRATQPGVLFTQTATGTVANTAAETTLVSTGVGTMTLPANFLVAGRSLRIKASGFFSTISTPNVRWRVKLGAVILLDTTTMAESNFSNMHWELNADITCRTTGATGTVFSQGRVSHITGTGTLDSYPMVNTTATTVNTTAGALLDVMFTYGTANVNNSISQTNLIVDILN